MERGSGNDNDEIAVAPPLWIDVDGDGPQNSSWPLDGNCIARRRNWSANGRLDAVGGPCVAPTSHVGCAGCRRHGR